MYTKSNNIDIMIGFETDQIIEKLFESLLQRYQNTFEEKMRGSEFTFDGVDLLHYEINKTGSNQGGSYIDSSKW